MEQHPSAIPPELRDLLLDLAKGYITGISIEDVDFEVYGLQYFIDQAASASSSRDRRRSQLLGQTTLSQRVAQIKQEGEVKSVQELYTLIKSEPLLVYIRDELRKFIVAYLTVKPENVIEFGVDYFEKRRGLKGQSKMPRWRRESSEKPSPEPEVEVPRKIQRRAGVVSESVKLDEQATKLPDYPKTPQQKQALRVAMANVLLFKSLDVDQMEAILRSMFKVEVSKGDYVINQGEDGDYFYVIEKGLFEVYVKDGDNKLQQVTTYKDSGSFGELALMYNLPRVATVKAASDGLLWALDRESFRQIVVKSTFQKRRLYEQLISAVPVLGILSQDERSNLADSLQPKTFANGSCIIKQGDDADGMYFVEEGTVEVMVKNADNDLVSLDKIGKGGYFGELALVTRHPRAASAYARGTVKCAYLNVEAFERLLGPVKELMAERAKGYKIIEGIEKVEVRDAYGGRPGASGLSPKGSKNTPKYSNA